MNTLRESLAEYLSLRRALGFKLERAGIELSRFVVFLENKEAKHISVSLALEWAQQRPDSKPLEQARRLSYARGFARFRISFDPLTEVPPCAVLPVRSKRVRPYFYSEVEVQRLIEAALSLTSVRGLGRQTFYCLLGLLSVSGLRLGEALALEMKDVDLDAGLLTVNGAKFGKSRLVPLQPSTVKVLAEYKEQRARFLRGRVATQFFISLRGTRLGQAHVHRTFYRLLKQVGLWECSAHARPRLHDFRHSFAMATMVMWYRNGEDVERRLPVLATYLGHTHISDTYWYLRSCPELMGSGVRLLEQRWEANS